MKNPFTWLVEWFRGITVIEVLILLVVFGFVFATYKTFY